MMGAESHEMRERDTKMLYRETHYDHYHRFPFDSPHHVRSVFSYVFTKHRPLFTLYKFPFLSDHRPPSCGKEKKKKIRKSENKTTVLSSAR